MDEDLKQKLEEQDKKLNDIYRSVERMRKYFLWTLIITVVIIILPLIGLVLIIPWFLKIINSAYSL